MYLTQFSSFIRFRKIEIEEISVLPFYIYPRTNIRNFDFNFVTLLRKTLEEEEWINHEDFIKDLCQSLFGWQYSNIFVDVHRMCVNKIFKSNVLFIWVWIWMTSSIFVNLISNNCLAHKCKFVRNFVNNQIKNYFSNAQENAKVYI